jgi:hypothetical protein
VRGVPDRLVLSPSVDEKRPGLQAAARRHGDFDDDPLVRASLTTIVGG